jgi:short-subunit dehydrogenase
MKDLLISAIDAWIARRAEPVPSALAAVADLAPAAVITGASRGIGLALARRFAKAGSPVVLIARRRGPLEEAAVTIVRDFGVRAIALDLDVTHADAPREIDQALAAQGLYNDCLVNNAGIGLSGAFHDNEPQDLDRLIDLNVSALVRLMHHALLPMRARGRGGILNVASLGGMTPGPYQAAYYASKAFVISLTEAVAYEVKGEGVRIAVVAPGPVETGFHAAMGADRAIYRALFPSSSPEQVAHSAYRGFMLGRRVIVPGVIGTVAALALRVVPHAFAVPLVGHLLFPGFKTRIRGPNDA